LSVATPVLKTAKEQLIIRVQSKVISPQSARAFSVCVWGVTELSCAVFLSLNLK